jgi:beta-lactamase regulating signal transducer with metallopeptidase domain
LIESLSVEELEVMLAHELAHICRKDNFSLWLGSLAKNFFVFVPLRGRLWRSFLQRREEACDDLAVAATGKPLILAETLVKACRIASELPSHLKSYQVGATHVVAPYCGVEWESLERRVMRLINSPMRKSRIKKVPFVIFAVAFISLISLFVWAMGESYYCLL